MIRFLTFFSVVIIQGCISIDSIAQDASHLVGKCMVLQEDAILVNSSRFERNGLAIVRLNDKFAFANPDVIVGRMNKGLEFYVQSVFPHFLPMASCWRVKVEIVVKGHKALADYPACGAGTRESWMNSLVISRESAKNLQFDEKYAVECN